MNNEQIIKKIILKSLGLKYPQDLNQLKPKAKLIFDLGADSLSLFEIQKEIENKLNIEIPEEISYHSTIRDLCQIASA